MRLTIAYSKIKKQNLLLINNDTHQRETLSEQPIRPPLKDISLIIVIVTFQYCFKVKSQANNVWLNLNMSQQFTL